MATEPAVPVQREVSGFPRPFFSDLAKVALAELHDTNRPGNAFGCYDVVEAFNPLSEKGNNPNSGISVMVREGDTVILGVPRMLKVGTTFSCTVLVDYTRKIHLANPQRGVVIALDLFSLSVAV